MKLYKKLFQMSLLLFVLSYTSISALSQDVLHVPAEHKSFTQRLDWTRSTATSNPALADGYWIGYSVERYMHENSRMGHSGRNDKGLPTLQELLLGVKRTEPDAEQERSMITAAQEELRSVSTEDNRKVLKEVAILFCYPSSKAGVADFENVTMSTMDCFVDLKDRPLIWLGKVKDEESIPYLDKLYEDSEREKCKRGLMAAVSMHETKNLVIPCLQSYATQEESAKVRSQAVFWLAQQDHQDAFEILKKVVRNDASSKVREETVFWIGQKAKTDDLIEIIEIVALKDSVREVRKKAVFALSQAPDERGVDALIKIARSNKDRTTQKEAIFWLGQKASEKAMKSLEDIVFDVEQTELQERAVFAISQQPKDRSIPALSRICKDHPNPEVRKKAIFWLGQTGDSRAVDVLAEILKKAQ
ncbi:MAG: HEAT repeat domain-containing protein [Sedimentisphaerales bacterium]|nr:HEAT repeat domain-containing protein [Sedimentisphaerales bacterium]